MSFIFHLLIFLILLMVVSKSYRGYFSISPNSTVFLGFIFFSIIHIVMPALQEWVGFYRYKSTYEDFYFVISLIFSFTIFLTFFLIFNINFPNLSAFKISREKIAFKYVIFSLCIFLIGLYFSVSNLKEIFSMGLDLYLQDRIGFGYGSAYKMLLSDWIYVSSILFFIGLFVFESKFYYKIFLLLFLSSFIYTLFYYSITGNRNSIFVVLTVLTSLYFVLRNRGKKIPFFLKTLVGSGVLIVFFLLHYVGQLRSSGFQEKDIELTSSKTLVESFNGAFGNHENIVWLISNNYDYQYGITYLAAFTNFIPRVFWEDKILGAGPRLKNFIYPGSYVPGQEGNSSLTTGLVTEVLINFNIVFSIIFTMVFAFILKLIVLKFINSSNLIVVIIGIIASISISTLMLYSEFLGFVGRIFFMLLPLFIASFIFKIRVSR